MSFQRKLFWLENWHQSSSVQLWQTLVCKTFLETFLKFAPEPHGHKKQTEKLLTLTIRDSQDLSLKSNQHGPSTPWPYCLCTYRIGWIWTWHECQLASVSKGANCLMLPSLWLKVVRNVNNAVAGDIMGVYDTGTYQVGDTLTVGKNKFEFEPLPTFTPEILRKFLLRMSWSRNPSTRGWATGARRCYSAL